MFLLKHLIESNIDLYTIQFHLTAQNANADALSRLFLPEKPACVPLPGELVLLINHLAEAPITAAQLKAWTAKDDHFIRYVWQNRKADSEKKLVFHQ